MLALPDWTERVADNKPVVLVSDSVAWNLTREQIEKAYSTRKQALFPVLFDGEITFATIERTTQAARAHQPGVVVGLGGGKALDVAKGVARNLGTPIITAPTIASNDAPTAMALAVYDEHHVMVAVESMGRNPDVVLVDTAVIAAAPKRFLLSGIGDALAKKFEGEAADFGNGNPNGHGTRPLRTGLVIGDGCYRLIREHAESAITVAGSGSPNDSFEFVVEACALLSGLAFENTGLSIAHSMTRGLMVAPATSKCLHGEHVAYALLVQLQAEGRTQEFMADMLAFYARIGLPSSLRDLGMASYDKAQVDLIVERSMKAPHLGNVLRPVDSRTMLSAIEKLEQRQ